jgi:hypothetical protein
VARPYPESSKRLKCGVAVQVQRRRRQDRARCAGAPRGANGKPIKPGVFWGLRAIRALPAAFNPLYHAGERGRGLPLAGGARGRRSRFRPTSRRAKANYWHVRATWDPGQAVAIPAGMISESEHPGMFQVQQRDGQLSVLPNLTRARELARRLRERPRLRAHATAAVRRGGGVAHHGLTCAAHSRASFWASAICAGVMRLAILSLSIAAPGSPCAAAKLLHMCART